MPRSVVQQFRSGEWRRFSVTSIVVIAAFAELGDLLTTAHILTAPEYYESNPILAGLADVTVLLALAYMAAVGGAFVLAAGLSLGWISRVAALIAVSKLALVLNNLVLFASDEPLFDRLGVDVGLATMVLLPVVAVSAAVVWEAREYGLPRREVGIVLAVVAVLIGVPASGL